MAPRILLVPLLLLAPACGREPDLVVYIALDQHHSERLVEMFEERTGLEVEAHYDVERNKTVGLVNRIRSEAAHPYADVFWNNEIAHTIRLKEDGLTQPFDTRPGPDGAPVPVLPENARGIPEDFRDPEGHWTGFAARARVILYREDLLPEGVSPPPSVDAMLDPARAAVGGMARPLTGTTLTHFAMLSWLRGRETVQDWLRRAKASGLHLGAGNADVMRKVTEKDLAWCLTDTDDAAAARRNGHPVQVLYPGQGEDEPGTLLIPNTICILRGAPHPEAARRFVEFVLSHEVEALLAASDSEQIPLHPGVEVPPELRLPGRDFPVARVDWAAVAQELREVQPLFEELFID